MILASEMGSALAGVVRVLAFSCDLESPYTSPCPLCHVLSPPPTPTSNLLGDGLMSSSPLL